MKFILDMQKFCGVYWEYDLCEKTGEMMQVKASPQMPFSPSISFFVPKRWILIHPEWPSFCIVPEECARSD